jgi:hypothetical protein
MVRYDVRIYTLNPPLFCISVFLYLCISVSLYSLFSILYSLYSILYSLLCRMRIVALSATLPNLADVGEWLGCAHDCIRYFGESYRPVPLTVHTLPQGSMNNPFLFDKSLDDKVLPIICR